MCTVPSHKQDIVVHTPQDVRLYVYTHWNTCTRIGWTIVSQVTGKKAQNLSIVDTTGTQLAVLCREVSLIQR